jgi:hypothetical protein
MSKENSVVLTNVTNHGVIRFVAPDAKELLTTDDKPKTHTVTVDGGCNAVGGEMVFGAPQPAARPKVVASKTTAN